MPKRTNKAEKGQESEKEESKVVSAWHAPTIDRNGALNFQRMVFSLKKIS
jgi:hypothetical protein